ncbi:MAG TPA: glycoside hydrolase [Bacteroides graminisolvens]|uniref:Glycoside hydrolase n=1 Tax=Bacteroides graminisolvens TaxID=477666 RepID=A0A3D2SJ08_9BACE|nr:glycoside hydrolase [Bacteroides graminisolvens]
MKKLVLIIGLSLFVTSSVTAQKNYVSEVWVADKGDGTYRNPIIHADYSDPDACRVGDDYYMTSSSFNCLPALQILHSKDLVNWTIIGAAVPYELSPVEFPEKPQHGSRVWAPSIRYHKGEFYIFWGDPDQGAFMTKAKDPKGPWSEPVLVKAGKGIIDTTPLWDEDGKVYMVHGYAGSRSGIKSLLGICELNADATKAITQSRIIFDGHDEHPTAEGPKFYKRNGYYYIFAPAGGVTNGWQLVMRSRSIFGPYESRKVLEQGKTVINGPHQGAWVETASGESWFLHFQDRGAYGRVVHLQPMAWKNDWPVMGSDPDGDGCGEPVLTFRKPNVGKTWPVATPAESDEFDGRAPGLQWQWHANPGETWGYPVTSAGTFRLYSVLLPEAFTGYRDVPNLFLQKFPAPEFTATVKMAFRPSTDGERAGLIVIGDDLAYVSLTRTSSGLVISQTTQMNGIRGGAEAETERIPVTGSDFYLRVTVREGAKCSFSYSLDGTSFVSLGNTFQASEGRWIGAKVGMFCSRTATTNRAGFADLDWFRVTP